MFHPFPEARAKVIERTQKYISCDPLFLDMETTGLSDMEEIWADLARIKKDLSGHNRINSQNV